MRFENDRKIKKDAPQSYEYKTAYAAGYTTGKASALRDVTYHLPDMADNAYYMTEQMGKFEDSKVIGVRASNTRLLKRQLMAIRDELDELDEALAEKYDSLRIKKESDVTLEFLRRKDENDIDDKTVRKYRENCVKGITGELADVIICCLTMSKLLDCNIEKVLMAKMQYNAIRLFDMED